MIHAVGGGTGVRITCVYCQHEDLVTSIKKVKKQGKFYIMMGARCSVTESTKQDQAKIACLSKYNFGTK